MLGAARRVFGLVVVELHGRHDLDDAERLVAHHRAGQLLAGDVGLDQHGLAEGPVVARQLLRRVRHVLAHDEDADAGAFRHRLDHIRRRQQMALGGVARARPRAAPAPARRPREHRSWPCPSASPAPRRARRNGCRECRAISSMPCSVPSSPGRPCSTLSAASGLSWRKRRGDVAVDVDAADAVAAGALERVGAGLARAQRHLALGRPASHQDRDVLHRLSSPSCPRCRWHRSEGTAPDRMPGQAGHDGHDSDPLDFPFQLDAGIRLHPLAHGLAQRLDVGARWRRRD